MPKISDSAISKGATFLKPGSFKDQNGSELLNFGDKKEFLITGPHVETKQKDNTVSYSVPVSTKDGLVKGSFSINKSNMKLFVDQLTDDSDTWTNAEFVAMVLPVRNPQTNTQVKGWSVIKETIKKPTKKVGAK